MAHLSEGKLRRMFDDPDAVSGSDREHYAGCEACKSRYSALADDARAAVGLLAVPDVKVDVDSAFRRVTTAPAAQPRFGIRLPVLRPAARPMFAGFAAAVVVAALVVTAFANLLPIFQPKTVEPVPVTVGDLQALSALSGYGTLTWSTQPQPQVVLSAADAEKVSGLPVPTVGTLPAGVSKTVTYAAMPQAVAVFTFSASQAAAAAAKSGKSLPKLPAGMDGAKLTVTVGPAVVEVFGNLKAQGSTSSANDINLPQLVIAEATAPLVTSTQVSAKQIEDYLLSIPGLSPELASAIRSIGDPTTTLPIPVPIQYATSSKVTVQGVQGLALGDNTGLGSAVIWIKDGSVYGVFGLLKQTDVLDVANQLQ